MDRHELPLETVPAMRRGVLEVGGDELADWLRVRGEPKHRARQIQRWIVAGRATSFDAMTDLPQSLRTALAAEFSPLSLTVARRLTSTDGTEKLLLQLADGAMIECVLMREEERRTVCVSTQVGCGMGCVFCASGIGGVVRNLTSAEIVQQLLLCRNLLPGNERLSHIVVMGMGEPLANLDNLLAALEIACSADSLGLSARHIHISTVGLPAKIRRLADLDRRYHLAVSLHAPNDELRTAIVPTNDKTGIAEILSAADYYFDRTGRQVTYEYVLLRDVNDRVEHAFALGRLLHGRKAHVNLIPFNDVDGLPHRRVAEMSLSDFQATLHRYGVSATVRKRRGADIDAACGQLRRSALQEPARPELLPVAGV